MIPADCPSPPRIKNNQNLSKSPQFKRENDIVPDASPIAMRYWNQSHGLPDAGFENHIDQNLKHELFGHMKDIEKEKGKLATYTRLTPVPDVPNIRERIKENDDAQNTKMSFVSESDVSRKVEMGPSMSKTHAFLKPPKLPFLNDIQLLRGPSPKHTSSELKSENDPPKLPAKTKINHHLGHIENRPKPHGLPFLEDIKTLKSAKDDEIDNSVMESTLETNVQNGK